MTHFRLSNFGEATEWVDNEHLRMLGRRIAKGLQHLEVTDLNKMLDDGRWSIIENFLVTAINNAT